MSSDELDWEVNMVHVYIYIFDSGSVNQYGVMVNVKLSYTRLSFAKHKPTDNTNKTHTNARAFDSTRP